MRTATAYAIDGSGAAQQTCDAAERAADQARRASTVAMSTGDPGDHHRAYQEHAASEEKSRAAANLLHAVGDERAKDYETKAQAHHRQKIFHKQEADALLAQEPAPGNAILATARAMALADPGRFPTATAAADEFLHTRAGDAAYHAYRDQIMSGNSNLPTRPTAAARRS